MATVIQYNALTPIPAPGQPTPQQLQTAKNESIMAENGDGQPLPPPFTYGKIYNNGKKINKLQVAPSLSRAELQALMTSLPKPDTRLQLPNAPIGSVPVSSTPTGPSSFMDLANLSLKKKRRMKLGKRLNAKVINKATRRPESRAKDNYELLIELSTNLTGKHTIFYSTRMADQEPKEGPLTEKQQHQQQFGLPGNYKYPTLKRIDKVPPYTKPRDKKNKKWTNISNTLGKWLDANFHSGNELAFPNPLYPPSVVGGHYESNAKHDKIFRISNFEWQFLPTSLDNLTGKKPPFKFYITNNLANFKDTNLYIVLKVRLTGRYRRGNKIQASRALPVTKPKQKGKLKKAASFCNKQATNMKNIVVDRYHSAPGIFTDSTSEKFEKKVKKAIKTDIVAKNLKLYYENSKKALDYWEQEYYCRQAMNFNAGTSGGWPNITPAAARFPFDPWTLQPAISMTAKSIDYPNGIPGSRPNANAENQIPNSTAMRAWYAAQPAGFQRPPWPLPFAPFGLSLKPKDVITLFARMNNFINTPVGPIQAAATALQSIMVQGKLPRLNTLHDGQMQNVFTLYEYVLYNPFTDERDQHILEPWEPYPELPQPVAGATFGTWLISPNKRQFAIPVATGIQPWDANVVAPALPALIPGQAPRVRVSWQQVKKNRFYKTEAKKWADWMVLLNPFPIPGFPQYTDYIVLLQKYKLSKLNAASTIPQPSTVLVGNQINTQLPLPPGDNNFRSQRIGGFPLWTFPSNANRTASYINPYAAVTMPAGAPGGWMPRGFLNLIGAQPSIAKWLFTGPTAGQYPKQIWPINNMRINGANVFPPLEDVNKFNVRRSKRKSLGGWQGGRKKRTMRRYRKKRRNRTLKRRRK